VVDLKINPPLDDALFRIDQETLPPGVRVDTEVLSVPVNSPRQQSVTYTGERQDLWQERDELLKKSKQEAMKQLAMPPSGGASALSKSSVSPAAISSSGKSPAGSTWPVGWIAIISAAVGGGALFYFVRPRKDRRNS
jgi:hypothetical protein